jgi:hypothetical protein
LGRNFRRRQRRRRGCRRNTFAIRAGNPTEEEVVDLPDNNLCNKKNFLQKDLTYETKQKTLQRKDPPGREAIQTHINETRLTANGQLF